MAETPTKTDILAPNTTQHDFQRMVAGETIDIPRKNENIITFPKYQLEFRRGLTEEMFLKDIRMNAIHSEMDEVD